MMALVTEAPRVWWTGSLGACPLTFPRTSLSLVILVEDVGS